jgi:hypothetical protein
LLERYAAEMNAVGFKGSSIRRGWTDWVHLDASIVAAFVVSRLLVVAAALTAEYLMIRNPFMGGPESAPILRSLTTWDGQFYLGIIRDWYHVEPVFGAYRDVAFLPLYPLVVRILAAPWPQLAELIAVVVSNATFLVALGVLARLGEPYLGPRRAVLAASLLAIFPFASVFAMAYSESLFLLLMVTAFLAAERQHRAWAGALFALACLTRFQGLVLLLPLLLLMARQDGWRLRPSHLWLVLGPAATVGYLWYIATLTGSVTGYLDAQGAWGREGFGGTAAEETIGAGVTPYQAALLLTLSWAVFMLVWVRRDHIRLEYALIPVLFIAAELSSGSLEAVGRVTMMGFPYVWLLANRRSVFARRSWPILSAGLFTLIAILSFGGYWVP